MIARFLIKNLFSFKEQTEFNLFPGKASRLKHHRYERKGIDLLKLSALYGANGSGKSNLIKAIALLKELVLTGSIPNALNQQKFKLDPTCRAEPTELGIEFFCNTSIYYYSISIMDNVILDEYFCESGMGKEEDKLIFHRKTENARASIQFFKEFEENKENVTLSKVIAQDLLKENKPLFTLLNTLSNDAFIDIRVSYSWFKERLQIIFPETSTHHLAEELHTNTDFSEFANQLMCSFNTGITALKVEVKKIEDFLGNDNPRQLERIVTELTNNPKRVLPLMADPSTREEVSIVNENGTIVAKRVYFEHLDQFSNRVPFQYNEESDGTRRLLEYIPALGIILTSDCTFIIDELERSIHPLIIKEILAKFSNDQNTKGQLVFSTHESNLLDQDIFRTDEIWFAEKDQGGATKLYPLSDFKEHNTIDIRKGYLNGRYGAIPFLGNLQDLNWKTFEDAKQE